MTQLCACYTNTRTVSIVLGWCSRRRGFEGCIKGFRRVCWVRSAMTAAQLEEKPNSISAGLTESTLQFVTYEMLKSEIAARRQHQALLPESDRSIFAQLPRNITSDFFRQTASCQTDTFIPESIDTFSAAAVAKLGAAILTYPHEVHTISFFFDFGLRKLNGLVAGPAHTPSTSA